MIPWTVLSPRFGIRRCGGYIVVEVVLVVVVAAAVVAAAGILTLLFAFAVDEAKELLMST